MFLPKADYEADLLPEPANDEEIRTVLRARAIPAISFRRPFPPRLPATTLTFFGGAPVAPAGFRWPRHHGPSGGSFPLTFIAQVDCASLPNVPQRELMPRDGVLHFFVPMRSTSRGGSNASVVYTPGPAAGWSEVEPPADAPIINEHDPSYMFSWLAHADEPLRHYPRSFTKWPVEMGAIQTYLTANPYQYDSPGGQSYYRLRGAMEIEALEPFHGAPVPYAKLEPPRKGDRDRAWRPFAGFPHVWLAIEMAAGEILAIIHRERRHFERAQNDPKVARDLARPADEQLALFDVLAGEAHAWVRLARANDLLSQPSEAERAEFWHWLDRHAAQGSLVSADRVHQSWLLNRALALAATESAEACLAASPAHTALVPSDVAEVLRARHSAVTWYGDLTQAHLRHQMFGEPRRIQEAAYADDHLLLLQLDNDPALHWYFGDGGAYQYWITPDDLAAGRFDKVVLTCES